MKLNARYNFDEDIEIYATGLIADARAAKEEADNKASEAADRAEAVGIIISKFVHFFKYFEGYNLLGYVDMYEAADQIIHSLADVGDVPQELIEDAAKSMLETEEDADRRHILKALIEKINAPIEIDAR